MLSIKIVYLPRFFTKSSINPLIAKIMTKRLLNLHTIQKITLILTTLFLLPSNLLAQNTYSYGNNVNISYDNNSSVYWDENHTYVWNVSMTGGEANSDGFSAFETLSLTFTEPLKGKLSSLNFQSSIITSDNNVNINVYKLDKFEGGTRTLIGPITISTSGTGSATPEYVFNVNSGTALFDNQYIQIAFERIDQNKQAEISANAVEGIVLTFNGTAYPLYVGNYRVTSNNADNIFGDSEKTASYTYNDENNNGTLTLNGANINGSISSGSYLDVILTGNNTITNTTGEGDFYAFRNSNTTNIQIDLKTDENNPGTLKIVGIKDNSYISTSTCSEQFTYGTVGDKTWKEEYGEENDISYLLLSLNKKYKLWKNGIQYHDLGLENNDGFSFDPGTSTLTITNSCDSIRSGLPELTIAINGEVNVGTVKGEFSTSLYETGKCSLTITKDPESESVNNSLTLNSEDGVITGFKSVIIDNSLHIIEPETTPKTWDKNIHKAVISDDIPYDIWIDNYRFTQSKPNGGFSGEISYDDNTHTLSLGGISYSAEIRSCLPELIIKLKNSNSLSIITFDNEHASGMNSTLIFEKDGNTSESYELIAAEISGFKNILYRNGLGKKTQDTSQQGGTGILQIIEPMTKPEIEYEDNGIKLSSEYEGDIIYSYDYVNEEITDIENNIYDQKVIALSPGTITAYVQTSEDNTSPITKGKFFEFAGPLKTTFDGEERILEDSDFPELLPKVEGMEYSFDTPEINNVIGTTVVSDVTKLTVRGLGKANIGAFIMPKDSYDFDFLNANGDGRIELTADILPSAPIFSINEGTYDEAQSLVLTSPYKKSESDNQTTVNIKYYLDGNSDNPELYSNQISISKSSTITAWVEIQVKSAEGGAPITYESEKVTKEYTIKQEANIAFKQESNGGFVDIEAGTTITSIYGHVAPKIMLSGTSDLQGIFVFTSSNENVVASSSISKVFNEEQEVTLLNYTIKGVGETTITAQYTPSNDEPLLTKTISFSLKVNARNISDATFTLSNTSFTYTGSPIEPETTVSFAATATTSAATLNKDNDYNISYIQINGELETTLETAPTNVGSYKATAEGKGNYTGEADATFSITAATMTVTAEGYEGTYDNQAHGITVTAPEGATVKYGSLKGTYNLTESPKYTDAGTYKVHYQVTMDNYTTVTDSATVEISKADITPEVTLEGWTYGTTANLPSVTGNSGNGAVTYTYKAEGSETFVETMPEVVGTHTIKASIAETTNYNAGEATSTYTITAATTSVTAKGYKGAYDNQPHGISITAPEGATVKYGTEKGTYNLDESPTYTDAGTYMVHYQVTMVNYTTVTDSATIEISKADITPTVTLEGWIFGTTANTPSVTGNTGNGAVTYTYKAEGTDTFVEAMPEVVGTHTIKASIAETTNYNAGEATATFTITASTMTVTANGYEGTYDGKAHGITVTAPEGATVMYGTQKDTYNLTVSPTYTNAGTYKVHYQVTMDNHTTVADSATVKISKAEAELEFDVPEEGKVYATIGKEFTEPTLSNLHELSVTYGSSDESVATVDETTGKVTLISAGLTYITATFAGNNNYNELEVKYELRVKGTYNLWINNVQVTSDNYNDILENQKFFYDLVNKWLIITDNETPVTVKSSMPELTIYLNGKSELERIYFDNQGNAQNTGTLSFITYSDLPGKLILDTNNDNGVISGFSSISFDENTNLRIIEPDSCEYKDGLLKMTRKDQLGDIVKIATIGQYIEPMVNGDGIDFDKDIDGNTNITNITIDDKLLITAMQHEEDTNEDDDYYDPSSGAIVLNTTNTSEDVEVLSQEVESGNKTPGSGDYADSFRGGITFMVPSGKGTIELEVMTGEGYMLMLKIGTGEPHEIIENERATVTIEYDVEESTYVYLYLQEKPVMKARWAGNVTRVGKRDTAHGRIYAVKVKASVVKSSNPLNSVEGAKGNVTIPTVNTVSPSNDDDVPTKAELEITNDENNVNDDKWFTIDGRRIDKPTQKGLYIRNRKKIVVK